MTAIGHFSMISETEINPSIITFFVTLRGTKPLYADELISLWKERNMADRHPRFHYTIDSTTNNHFIPKQYPTTNNNDSSNNNDNSNNDNDPGIESHITETLFPWGGRREIIDRIKNLQMDRWSLQDTLWHMFVAPFGPIGVIEQSANNLQQTNEEDNRITTSINKVGDSILFFRGHHVLGDGASIGATLIDLFDEADLIRQQIIDTITKIRRMNRDKYKNLKVWQRIVLFLKKFYNFWMGVIDSLMYNTQLHYDNMSSNNNTWNQIRKLVRKEQGKSYDPTDRTISYSTVAPVEQVKWVANMLGGSNCTINDVFISCLSAALVKQIQYYRTRYETTRSKEEDKSNTKNKKKDDAIQLSLQKHFHIAMPVHLKGGVVLPGESLGNNLGAIVARVPGEVLNDNNNNMVADDGTMCQKRLQIVHNELSVLKKLPIALLSHIGAKALSYTASILPLSWVSKLYESSNAGSIAVISNNRSSSTPLHLNGRTVESFYGFVPLPPGIPIGLVLLSYNGTINCTVTAQSWAVPDADQFIIWMLEEYVNLVKCAQVKQQELDEQKDKNSLPIAL